VGHGLSYAGRFRDSSGRDWNHGKSLHNIWLNVPANSTQLFIAWLAGARFDIAFSEMRKGNIMPPKPGSPEAADAMSRHAHVEL